MSRIGFDGDVASRIARALAALNLTRQDGVRLISRWTEDGHEDVTVEVTRPSGATVTRLVRERRRRKRSDGR